MALTEQLTDIKIRNATPKDKPYKLSDGGGLYLEVSPSGGKLWRLKYRFDAKEKRLSFGGYPVITLKAARNSRDDAKRLLANNQDPAELKRKVKAQREIATTNSFETIALEWVKQRTVEPAQIAKSRARLMKDVFPWLGKKPINEITAPDVLSVMKRLDARGARYTAHKVHSEISQIMRYAIAHGRAERDPCPDLRGAIPPAREQHHAAIIEPVKVAEMLRAFDAFTGTFIVATALRLAPLVFVRPGELRKAKWSEIDLDTARWSYTASKTQTEHIVPLSSQAVALLREIQPLTGHGEYVFHGARATTKPMSDAAINAALRRMGYDTKTEMTGHGFRAMARTILHEVLKFKPEVIEHQLAHSVADTLGTAYNRTKFIDDRVEMMQTWGDYLDKLKQGAVVIPFKVA